MARESAMKRAVRSLRDEAQKNLNPLLDEIAEHETQLELLRSQACGLQAEVDRYNSLLAMEEQIRKDDAAEPGAVEHSVEAELDSGASAQTEA